MVAEIAAMARETGAETGRPRFGDAVMAAMGKVPRHRFVPFLQEIFAYDNRPLPIGEGQTISQPYIVALMTDLLELKSGDTVLEVGTGSATATSKSGSATATTAGPPPRPLTPSSSRRPPRRSHNR